jgi:hypothetical protein
MAFCFVVNCGGTAVTYDAHGEMDNGTAVLKVLDLLEVESYAAFIASGDLTRSIFIYDAENGELITSVLATE